MPEKQTDRSEQFARQAEQSSPGLFREYLSWLRHTRKWWMAPILLTLLVIGFLVMANASGVGPLLYTLF